MKIIFLNNSINKKETMPRRRKYQKKRKTYKKRYRKKPRVPLPLGGFTDTKIVKLRWVKPVKLDAASNSYAIQTFNAAGCTTIQTADTHQPANFDIWTRRYNKYCVLGSKFTAVYTPDSTTQINPGYVGIYLTQDTTELATMLSNGIQNAMEQKNSVKMRSLTNLQSTSRQVSRGYSPQKLFGIPKFGIKIDDDFQGDRYDDPAVSGYFQLFVASIDGNNPGEMNFLVTIDYTIKCSGLLQQSPS